MIRKFRDEYWFLSNFYPCKILHKGRTWLTAEHLFQAMKTIDKRNRVRIQRCRTPAQVKKMGRQIKLRPNWDNIRLDIMRMVLSLKFRQSPMLREKLLSTENQTLVEGNYWHDNFWGDCRCQECVHIKGENHLGLLLMEIRNKFRQQEKECKQ